MNKIIINTGGQPFYLDDISFMYEAFADVIKGIIQGLNESGSFILNGCNVTKTEDGYEWSSGYIALKGEIFAVEAGSIKTSSSTLYWKAIRKKTDERQFEDLTTNAVHELSTVEISDSISLTDKYENLNDTYNCSKIFVDRIRESLKVNTVLVEDLTNGVLKTDIYKKDSIDGYKLGVIKISKINGNDLPEGKICKISDMDFTSSVIIANTLNSSYRPVFFQFRKVGDSLYLIAEDRYERPITVIDDTFTKTTLNFIIPE